MTSETVADSPAVVEGMPQPLVGLRRWAVVTLGVALIALGILGAILPGLPSTIFLLGASYCFARSSPRLHRWLLRHRHLGPPLRAWHKDRAMSRRAKATALVMMWSGVWISNVAMTGKGALVVAGLAMIGTVVVLFVVRTRAAEPIPAAPQSRSLPLPDRRRHRSKADLDGPRAQPQKR